MHTSAYFSNTLHASNGSPLRFRMEPQKLKYLVTDFVNDAFAGGRAKKQNLHGKSLGYLLLAGLRLLPSLITNEFTLQEFKTAFKNEALHQAKDWDSARYNALKQKLEKWESVS